MKKAERQAAVERSPEEFLPLTPAMFHILLALADRNDTATTLSMRVLEPFEVSRKAPQHVRDGQIRG